MGIDKTLELTKSEIVNSENISYTNEVKDIDNCTTYIVTVPTPINSDKQPNLEPLKSASKTVATLLTKNNVVIFESTVFPGATEEVCVPILEEMSGLQLNNDFFVGYSPERINPGDKEHTIRNIKKITSGSSEESLDYIDALYKKIVIAGTYKAKSIKTAEAAKVIENTQRDLNIALINELALIFNKMDIDTEEVLKAAGTKWNFLNFRPGLVGGHCIGVDPYYLTHKAQTLNYQPEIILAGRKLNDGMANYIGQKFIEELCNKNIWIENSNVLIMGLTFKENCPDLRNSKVIDLIEYLNQGKIKTDIYDPWVAKSDRENSKFSLNFIDKPKKNNYDGIIIAVGHDHFKELGIKKIREFGKKNHVIYDVKYTFSMDDSDIRL